MSKRCITIAGATIVYRIPFNKAGLTGNELRYIEQAVEQGHISGDGMFSRKCSELMEQHFGVGKALLTPSCTHALEIAAILLNLAPGDEILLPSFAFVSTANAFVLRGATPVFVEIRADTLNIDETKIEEKMTQKTKGIIALHYAGVSCNMDAIVEIAGRRHVPVIEDAAQGVGAKFKGRYLGSMGDLGAYSFHETKNYTCGEGGALLINRKEHIERAEIIRQKGTNRNQFLRGQVDKYTWCDLGSSYVLSDVLAAFLYAQLEQLETIGKKRRAIYNAYLQELEKPQSEGKVRLPVIPEDCESNFHLFHMLFESEKMRNHIIDGLAKAGILAVFHYVPLHTSPMGMSFGYKKGDLPITEDVSSRLLRLPFYNALTMLEIAEVTKTIQQLL